MKKPDQEKKQKSQQLICTVDILTNILSKISSKLPPNTGVHDKWTNNITEKSASFPFLLFARQEE